MTVKRLLVPPEEDTVAAAISCAATLLLRFRLGPQLWEGFDVVERFGLCD